MCCKQIPRIIEASKQNEQIENETTENKISIVWLLSDDLKKGRSPKSIYSEPNRFNRISSALGQTMEYSVEKNNKGKNEEIRIVNVKFVNSTNIRPSTSPSTIISNIRKNNLDEIVFPDKSTEDTDDKIRHIKKLYQKYTMDFKKLNSKKDSSDALPKRKMKFSIGYKSAKRKYACNLIF